ncbi:MAG: hypothetical protein Q9166_000358 [cf. Caloplaca sp. 2 TL-2023]
MDEEDSSNMVSDDDSQSVHNQNTENSTNPIHSASNSTSTSSNNDGESSFGYRDDSSTNATQPASNSTDTSSADDDESVLDQNDDDLIHNSTNSTGSGSNTTETPFSDDDITLNLDDDNSTNTTQSGANSTGTSFGDGDISRLDLGGANFTNTTQFGPNSTDPVDYGDSDATNSYQDTPSYNLGNQTCDDILGLPSRDAWKAVDGSRSLQSFIDMFDQDLLYCYDCFGAKKDQCDSKSAACKEGIKTRSKPENSEDPSWSIAAALYAQINSAQSFTCQVQPNDGCSKAPECQQCNGGDGTSASVILASLSNAYNSFYNTYQAIAEAGAEDGLQMNKFSDVFAPVPDKEGEILQLIIMTSLLGGLAGFIPGFGGAFAGMGAGLGAGIGMEKYFHSLPSAPDTSSSLGTILEAIKGAMEDMSNTLFREGEFHGKSSDGRSEVKLSLQGMMEKDGGTLVNPDGTDSKKYDEQRKMFKKTLYQQLAVLTWQDLQADKKKHIPFIATAPGKCPPVDPDAAVDRQEKDVGKNIMKALEKFDTSVTFEDNCYWLLDAKMTNKWSVSGHIVRCGSEALPGGTKKGLEENKGFFEELVLEDFIIPSVTGWQNHSKQNGYESASANGNLIKNLQDPGVINIPVCDYLTDYKHPGVGCPVLDDDEYQDEDSCKTIPESEGKNEPGQYSQGKCRAHVQQWKKDQTKNNANQLDVYQISVDVYDDKNRAIGSATKQKADKPLEVTNANLPFNLIVVPGGGDDDPMNFWYADQYWKSDDGKDTNHPKCSVGDYMGRSQYDSSSRQMDCGFDCPLPMPDEDPPKSATIDHPLPNPAVSAYAGPTSFENTYSDRPTPSGPAPAAATPTYAGGTCAMHVTQYQRWNEGTGNPTNDFQLELNVKDAKGEQAANLPKLPAPKGKKVTMNGLKFPFMVQVGDDESYDDYSMLHFSYDNFNFDQKKDVCKYGGYEDGNRDMDCHFNC